VRDGSTFSAKPAAAQELDPCLLVRVDGIDITTPEYLLYRHHAWANLGFDPDQLTVIPSRRHLELTLIEELIDRALLVSAAHQRQVSVPAHELELRHQTWIARLGGPDDLSDHLSQFGLEPDQLRELVRRELLAWRTTGLLTAGVEVSDRRVQQFYKRERDNPAHAALFVEPISADAAHIVIDASLAEMTARLERQGIEGEALDGMLSDLLARRRTLAETIRETADSGADFDALAAAFSEDPDTLDRGGSLGTVTPGMLAEPLERVVFALEAGQIGPVVHTARGFHVVKVLARRPARLRSLEEVQTGIHNLLVSRDRATVLEEWLESKRTGARIVAGPTLAALIAENS
jgi:hypothetical protein